MRPPFFDSKLPDVENIPVIWSELRLLACLHWLPRQWLQYGLSEGIEGCLCAFSTSISTAPLAGFLHDVQQGHS